MTAENFLSYVVLNDFVEAQKIFDTDIEFVLEEDYMKSLIITGNLPALKYLDDLGVSISQNIDPCYAVESNNINMVKYIINENNKDYFNYLAALRLAEKLGYIDIIDYIKTMIEVNPDLI